MTLEAWLGASVIGLGRAGGRLQEGGGGAVEKVGRFYRHLGDEIDGIGHGRQEQGGERNHG